MKSQVESKWIATMMLGVQIVILIEEVCRKEKLDEVFFVTKLFWNLTNQWCSTVVEKADLESDRAPHSDDLPVFKAKVRQCNSIDHVSPQQLFPMYLL